MLNRGLFEERVTRPAMCHMGSEGPPEHVRLLTLGVCPSLEESMQTPLIKELKMRSPCMDQVGLGRW